MLVAVVATLLLAACGSSSSGSGFSASPTSGAYRGDQLPQPQVLDPADLSDAFSSSAGGTTSLAALQKNTLMLLYFGYTHCPDVCPTTMADLGLALKQVPSVIQGRTQVVFVTSDPTRDTPPVMKAWLSNFDTGVARPFVGLTASQTQIDTVAQSIGIPIEPPVKQPNGTITVQHGAQTLAFINGKASVLWTAGTTPADYAHDITKLSAGLANT